MDAKAIETDRPTDFPLIKWRRSIAAFDYYTQRNYSLYGNVDSQRNVETILQDRKYIQFRSELHFESEERWGKKS